METTCSAAMASTVRPLKSKTVTALPPGSYILVFDYFAMDSWDTGESASLSINGSEVWIG